MSRMSATGALALLTLGLVAVAMRPIAVDRSEETSPLGDWVGWAYLDEGGDLPLRLRIYRDGKSLRVRFDELISERYDLPAELAWEPPRLIVTRDRPGESVIVLEGTLQEGTIRGRMDWAGHAADFDLSRSQVSIARIPPERFDGTPGIYRLSAERSLVVTARFWGELLVTDLTTGRFATLFPFDTDVFFVGSAMYVPDPIHAWVRFERNDDGEIVSVGWNEVGGDSLSGPRSSIVEEEIAFESDGARLVGTLLRPEGPGPFPAAVVLPGSGWTDREAGRRDAEILVSFGMAAFIYDKRGNGRSEGRPTVPFRQTARDAASAVAQLRQRAAIRPDQVGLTGRSRGGWIAPLAATMAPGTAFVILFVPPAVSPARQETTRRLNLLQDQGYSEEQIEAVRSMLEAAWRYAETGAGWDRYAAARERATAADVPAEIFEPASAEDPEWEWARLNMSYDPIQALESLQLPLLALFGERDRNVVVAENLPAMRDALERGGHPDFELFVVPGANHGLRDVTSTGDLPFHRQVGFGSAGWPTVVRWLGERFDLAAPERHQR